MRVRYELELAVRRTAARYRLGGSMATARIDLEAPAFRAVDRALDDDLASGDEHRALQAIALWEATTAALLRGGVGGRTEEL